MTFGWQMLVVSVVIAGAGLYLGRALWRWLRPKKSACGGSCGCSTQPASSSNPQLISVKLTRPDPPPASRNGS